MVSEKETTSIGRFVRGELRGEPDLSTLTLGILRKRYLAHVGRESLSPEARNYMKQVVQEELMKMQDNGKHHGELESTKSQNKRKREKEDDTVISGSEDEEESRAKKSRCQSSSSSESEDKEDCTTGSEESEEEEQIKPKDAEQKVNKSPPETNRGSKREIAGEDSADEEQSESENVCGEETKKEADGKKTDSDSSLSSDDNENENVSADKKTKEPDSDSSSLPSLEDERNSETENKPDNRKKKTTKKDESTRGQKDENRTVVRLKRYIALCGVRRNYKKLLDGCRSVRSMVAVLKKDLEELGVHGNPSIEKCKKVRMKREEAQELADLDMGNIISTQGRPKRRSTSAWQDQHDPPSWTYQRTLNSDSGSDEEKEPQRGRKRATDWANLQGIISDDGDSD